MRLFKLTIAWLFAFAAVGSAVAATLSRSMLIMHQSDLRGPFYYQIFSSLRSAVNADRGPPVTIYSENLDLAVHWSRL